MYNFVIWDFDGTLFDTYPVIAQAYVDELAAIGITEDVEKASSLLRVFFKTYEDYLVDTYGMERLGEDFFVRCRNRRVAAEQKYAEPFDGIIPLCRDIIAAGGRNVIYTLRDETMFGMFDRFGMRCLFADSIDSRENFPRKPAPDAVLTLLERCGADPASAIMVGDREIDVGSGENAGIDSCLFRAMSYEGTRATHIAHDVAELRQVLLG